MSKKDQKPLAAAPVAGTLDDIMTEKEVLDLFGLKKPSLDRMRREKKLPFCKLNNVSRIYLVRDVFDFIESQRTVMNESEE